MRRRFLLFIAIPIFFALLLVLQYKYKHPYKSTSFTQALTAGIKWFGEVQTANGDFVYSMSVPDGEVVEGNEIVRQAGALYGIAHGYRFNKDEQTKRTLERGFEYFSQITQPKDATSSAIVFEHSTKSNSSALLLLALIEYLETSPEGKELYAEQAKQLANFLITTQTPFGTFIYEKTARGNEQSPYNDGESFYALVRAYKYFHDEQYLASAKKSANFFLKVYDRTYFESGFYAWGMAGFAHLYLIDPQEDYWNFMHKATDKFMDDRGKYSLHQPKPGSAVFLEGVAHVAWIAKERDHEYYLQLKSYLEQMLNNASQFQIGSSDSIVKTDHPQLQGAVCQNDECSVTRIDYAQHYISALYLYLTLVKS